MLRRSSFCALALALAGAAACSSSVESPGTGGATTTVGGAGGATTTSSSAGGSGGTDLVDAGDAGDAGDAVDAPPDAPPGSCAIDSDCPPTGDPCTRSPCVAGMCEAAIPAFDFAACDDGDPCTENDYCKAGACAGSPAACPSVDACHAGFCDPILGCQSMPANDGAGCDDGDPCTGSGTCAGGVCHKGGAIDCSFLNGTCSQGVCDPAQGCIAAPKSNGASCDDNLFCTLGDHCQNGACVGSPNPCTQGNPCAVGVCNEATKSCTTAPGNNGAACNDGSVCTTATTCLNGVCGGGVPANDGALCDDGSACTTSTTCASGVCTGGQGPIAYFADDFHDNSKGWTLDTEWQIGAAAASTGQQTGNGDPSLDHTPTSDNGVAGVVLGGNASISPLHGFYYLTSPPFNTAAASGSVILGFYRWLNSDFAPWMTNVIEVWTGTAWVQVWKSGNQAISDAQWTYVSHDLTAYKNAVMRVRFGFDVAQNQTYLCGSWNIDDLLVASVPCP